MPFTQFTSLDFDDIKAQIRDFLRSNSNFSDFDFEGSNFSVLIDTLAYNTYINAFNANLVANESFLDSAIIRENVVSLARNIGYVPRSKTAATATIKLDDIDLGETSANSVTSLVLRSGLICIGSAQNTTFRFSIPDNVTSNRTSTLRVYVANNTDTTIGRKFSQVDNILNLNKTSEIYLIQEVQDEKYEILFGDGFFGKKLENKQIITATYIVTDGESGNGPSEFSFQGTFNDQNGNTLSPSDNVSITTTRNASNGSEQEDVSSIKYFAPRLYSAQYRAVTPRDYEAIIATIFPQTESVAVIGGEELDPPQFGKVQISIKPKNGTFVSDFDKVQIKNKLKKFAVAGINSEIVDLKILFVEIDSNVYYNPASVASEVNLRSDIIGALNLYTKNVEINKFGGRFKYSKINQLIDRVDDAITSNITKIIIRRDLKALLNQFAQYELCFGNRFYINPAGFNIKSTGFTVSGSQKIAYLTDIPNKDASGNLDGSMKGTISVVSKNNSGEQVVLIKEAGGVDYLKGEIILNTINFTSTVASNNLVEIQAFPEIVA